MEKNEILRAMEEDIFHVIISVVTKGTVVLHDHLAWVASSWERKGLLKAASVNGAKTGFYDWREGYLKARVGMSRSYQIYTEASSLALVEPPRVRGEGQDVVSGQDMFWLERIIAQVDDRLASPARETQATELVNGKKRPPNGLQETSRDAPARRGGRERKERRESKPVEEEKSARRAKRRKVVRDQQSRTKIPEVFALDEFDSSRQPEVRKISTAGGCSS